MSPKPKKLDPNKIAKALKAQPKGKVKAAGGYFGAMQLAVDVQRLKKSS